MYACIVRTYGVHIFIHLHLGPWVVARVRTVLCCGVAKDREGGWAVKQHLNWQSHVEWMVVTCLSSICLSRLWPVDCLARPFIVRRMNVDTYIHRYNLRYTYSVYTEYSSDLLQTTVSARRSHSLTSSHRPRDWVLTGQPQLAVGSEPLGSTRISHGHCLIAGRNGALGTVIGHWPQWTGFIGCIGS